MFGIKIMTDSFLIQFTKVRQVWMEMCKVYASYNLQNIKYKWKADEDKVRKSQCSSSVILQKFCDI